MIENGGCEAGPRLEGTWITDTTSRTTRQSTLLLLDEPTNNLDPASRAEILGGLSTYEGAVVLVTHDEGAVDALQPERILLLADGVEDL